MTEEYGYHSVGPRVRLPVSLPAMTSLPSRHDDELPAGQRPGLMVVHGHRAEQLLELAVAWTQRWPQPPLDPETWIVPSQAVGLWIKQVHASSAAGVAAGLDILLPAQWLWRAYRAVLGAECVPESAPLDKAALTWRLWRLLPTLGDPAYALLQAYLRHDGDGRRRYQLAHRLADLYDQYQVYRGDWLHDWACGDDVLRTADGQRLPLAEDDRWQALLWRRVLDDWRAEHTDAPRQAGLPSRVDIHAAFVQALQHAASPPPHWPRRLTVFGLAALPPAILEALALVARWSQVLVCVLNPCRIYWADLIPERLWLERAERHWRERAGSRTAALQPTAAVEAIGHPLLAAWGRQGRDFIALLQQYDERPVRDAFDAALRELGQRIDLFDDADTRPANPGAGDADSRPSPPPTLLQQLQDDVLHNRTLAETRAYWPPINPALDGSLRFHVCHTALREVEVLHDQIVAALHRDPTLRPRDIVVMAPNIAAYAPLVHAVFGRYASDDPRHVPYSVADSTDADSAQLLNLVRSLLDLPRQRLGVNTVLDWLQVPALARRLGLTPDDVTQLRRRLADTGVRWGLDGAHRQSLGAATDTGDALTWADGLRRLWLGLALGNNDTDWRTLPPTPGVSPMAAPLIERLQALLHTLQRYRQALSEAAAVPVWIEHLEGLLDDCLLADADADPAGWRLLQRLRQALHAWGTDARSAGDEPLPLAAVADAWLARIDPGRDTVRGFLGEGVTFATLLPMRAVPFRHVYLLGMHDGAYPRPPTADDFDLMARHPRAGDRLARHEDRYLFLQALLSAREHLSISWVGHSAHDGSERAPSVLVGQLRDHVAAGWRRCNGDGAALLHALTVEHRLHPFDPAYYPPHAHPDRPPTPGEPLFSYDPEWAPVAGAGAAGATAGITPPITATEAEGTAAAPAAGNPAQCGSAAQAHAPAVLPRLLPSPPQQTLPLWQPAEPMPLKPLLDFLRHPVRALYEQRLQVRWRDHDDTLQERDVAAPDGLQRWRLNEQWLRAVVRAARHGASWETALDAVQRVWRHATARGAWPAGHWGDALGGDWLRDAEVAWRQATRYWQQCGHGAAERDVLDCSLPTGDGALRWLDVIGEVRRNASGARHRLLWLGHALIDGLRRDDSSRSPWRLDHALPAWATHLAHHVAGGPLHTWVLSPRGCAILQPLADDEAQALWQMLVDLWWRGMRQPSPFEPDCALAWFQRLHKRDGSATAAWDDACARYEGSAHRDGRRQRDPWLRQCYPTFVALAGPREQAAHSLFGQLATTVYGPLRAAITSCPSSLDETNDAPAPDRGP